MSRATVYKQYKVLCAEYGVDMVRKWNTKGCTTVWITTECAKMVADRATPEVDSDKYKSKSWGRPKFKDEPKPKSAKPKPKPKYDDDWLKRFKAEHAAECAKWAKEHAEWKANWERKEAEWARQEAKWARQEAEWGGSSYKQHGGYYSQYKFGANIEHMDVLGLKRGYTSIELKKAYRRMALVHHPDKGGDDAMFRSINEAYEALR